MKNIIWIAALTLGLTASAAEPDGYYSSCEGKSAADLLAQLQKVVGSHTDVGYDGLWSLYKTSDVYDNGKIWDMYSTKQWTFSSEQCGSYKNVGDCYNREHSMPKSWFNDAKPMYSDGFHIYPTDGKVNGQRSNYPYGECAGGTTLAGNGNVKPLGRLGKSTFSGYSGVVFEPDDKYKGDFARSYFYMAAAYNDKIAGWSTSESNLGGTSYPAFNSWSVDLLMKWHREDPVSQKELDRNEAVYAKQRNRNPFIDHPEMAEHIWGDKKTTGWSGGISDPELRLPVDGSTIDFGSTMAGVARSMTMVVQGKNLSENITLSVSGSGFGLSTTNIPYSAACTASGYSVTVTFTPPSPNSYVGTVNLTCGSITRKINLVGSAISTIPVGPTTGISDDSFEAVWTYVGDDDNDEYRLDVTQGGLSITGYPKSVRATLERYVVDNLEPNTTYIYNVSSLSHKSQDISVTTLPPIPSVEVYFDGRLEFVAEVGEPSDAAELLLEIINIDNPVTLKVNSPFQLSEDKSQWSESITIDPRQERVYLRMMAQTAGVFNGTLSITADGYENDNVEFVGTAGSSTGFHEDFEADASGFTSYAGGVYQGTAVKWNLYNAGIYDASTDRGYNSKQAVRFGKESSSSISMVEDSPGLIGTVTLWAHKWSGDDDVAFRLEYSVDGGDTWYDAGGAEVTSQTYTQFTFVVNSSAPCRLRVRQTSGQRWLVDEIEASSYKSGLVPDAVADYHRWDAFCRGGQLVIESAEEVDAVVYALDATEVFAGRVSPGQTAVSVSSGLYIVAVDGFARRVFVK